MVIARLAPFETIGLSAQTKQSFLILTIPNRFTIPNKHTGILDTRIYLRYAFARLGGSGAAELCEPRQVREEAAISN